MHILHQLAASQHHDGSGRQTDQEIAVSHTVLIDEQERDRRFENRLNAVVRHCRIGRVTRKLKESGILTGVAGPARPDWFTQMGFSDIQNAANCLFPTARRA